MENEKLQLPKVVLSSRLGYVSKSEIRNKLCNGSYQLFNRMVHFAIDCDAEFSDMYKAKYLLKNSLPISVLNKMLLINDINETLDIYYNNGKVESK